MLAPRTSPILPVSDGAMNLVALVLTALATLYLAIRAGRATDPRKWRLVIAGALVCVALFESIPSVYLAVDRALGGINLFYLIAHLALLPAAYLITGSLAWAVSSRKSAQLVSGWPGICVLLLCASAMVVLFIATLGPTTRLNVGSAGLRGAFVSSSYAYLVWASAVLVVPMARAAGYGQRPMTHRMASGMMAGGFALSALAGTVVVFKLFTNDDLVGGMIYTAIILFSSALLVRWAGAALERQRYFPASK